MGRKEQAATGSSRGTLNPFKAFRAMGAEAQAMLVGILIMTIGTFMVLPLLALYLQAQGESPAFIGVVLTVLVVSTQGLPVFTGVLSDRWGARTLIIIGIVARSLGYLGLALGHGVPLLLASAFLTGLGGAAFTPAAKAVLAQTSGELRVEAFALRSAAVNAGAALGPLIGGLLFLHFQLVFAAAVVLFTAYLMVVVLGVRSIRPAAAGPRPRMGGIFVAMLQDRALLGLTVASIGFWFLYTQFNFTFSLYSRDAFGWTGQVGILFAANAVIVLALQYVLIAQLSRRLNGWGLCVAGAAVLTLGFASLGLVQSVGALILFTVLFSMGELLIVPTLDSLASDISPMVTVGSYLGFVSMGWALGGLVGNLAGGALYSIAKSAGNFPEFWGINVAVGVVTAATFLLLGRLVHPRVRAREAAASS